MNIQFGDEIEPISHYSDNKKRKYIFMQWMGGDLIGYARVATVLKDKKLMDEQGKWVGKLGMVLEDDRFVHKKNIEKLI